MTKTVLFGISNFILRNLFGAWRLWFEIYYFLRSSIFFKVSFTFGIKGPFRDFSNLFKRLADFFVPILPNASKMAPKELSVRRFF